MKRSKYWILFFIFCILAGGVYRLLSEKSPPQTLHILVDKEIYLAPELITFLKNKYHINVSITHESEIEKIRPLLVYENSPFDILIAENEIILPLAMENLFTSPSQYINSIHPDFRSTKNENYLPIFWKLDQKINPHTHKSPSNNPRLVQVSLAFKETSDNKEIISLFLETFFSKEYQLFYISQSDFSSTLLIFEELNVEKKKQPSYLRARAVPRAAHTVPGPVSGRSKL